MMSVLGFLIGAVALLLLMPATVLFAEVLFSLIPFDVPRREEGERGRIAVLMPAHNEAPIIATTLRSVKPQLASSDSLVVVADNCSDDTRLVAIAEGAEVVVRTDLARRGKGYALDYGVRHLERDPPQIVIVVDADCLVAPGTIDTLARFSARTSHPIQALYLMHAPQGSGLRVRIAEFAFLLKNKVRPLGLRRLGLPCQLMGTGMAFPWTCISTAALATGHIVEDLKLGIDLARAGMPPMFCAEALVTSQLAASSEGSQSQRTRWEHGHLGLIVSDAPRLLLESVFTLNLKLLALALDLSVPPLALLALMNALVWIMSASLFFVTKHQTPLIIASTSIVLLALSVLLSWGRYGRQILSLGNLVYAVFYAIMKVPLYVKFLMARQLNWVRSKRDHE
jgi:cellulose synthase/poly-beta-1,6-N-acetylglucosamine synthase-like glycosyltransferase